MEKRCLVWWVSISAAKFRCRVRIWRKGHQSMDPSCLVSMVQAGGGGVMVWGTFSWHTLGPLVPNWASFKCHSLLEYCCWPCPSLYDYSVPIFRQICSYCVMLSCQYGPKSLSNVSNTFLNLCHEELRQFWRQKVVQPGTSKVYLIKGPVTVYVCKQYIVCMYVCVYIYIYIYIYILNILIYFYDYKCTHMGVRAFDLVGEPNTKSSI